MQVEERMEGFCGRCGEVEVTPTDHGHGRPELTCTHCGQFPAFESEEKYNEYQTGLFEMKVERWAESNNIKEIVGDDKNKIIRMYMVAVEDKRLALEIDREIDKSIEELENKLERLGV